MSIQVESGYVSAAELNLWFKVNDSSDLLLSDVTELIPYRWVYFRDEWLNIKQKYIDLIPGYANHNLFGKQIDDFTSFIETQKNSKNKNNPFSNGDILYKFYTIFDNTSILELSLTREEQNLIDRKTDRVRGFIRKDFNDIRSSVVIARDYLADITGTADEDYNEIFGRSSVSAQLNIDNKNMNLMAYFQDTIKSIDFILANIYSLDSISVDPFLLAKQNANNPEIDISTYNSGKLKRFNYGESLQDISKRELGDSDRWIDIAIANGLKPPYIDEIGSQILMLSNANDNQLNIAGSADGQLNIDRLFVNQVILIKSTTYPFPDQRIIKNIKEAPVSGEIIIEVDGEPNLDRYKTSDDANIRVFKPNTINSSFLILIPSKEEVSDEVLQDTPWFLRSSSESEKRQKIDLMITDEGDLNFTSNEDFQLSFGLENAIQALKLKLSTETGELEKHRDYGITTVQGMKNSNSIEIESFITSMINSAIAKDPRYDRVERLKVSYFSGKGDGTGVGFDVSVEARLAGSSSVIPITFSLDL